MALGLESFPQYRMATLRTVSLLHPFSRAIWAKEIPREIKSARSRKKSVDSFISIIL